MDNVIGKDVKKRSKAADFGLLLLAGILVATLSTGAFWISEEHHVNPAWLLSAWAAVGFLASVGRDYRTKLNSLAFALFFLAWLAVHILVYLLVLAYLGFLYYVPVVVLELWVGYTLAIWLFGPPPRPTR
jgi:hypothetical protein